MKIVGLSRVAGNYMNRTALNARDIRFLVDISELELAQIMGYVEDVGGLYKEIRRQYDITYENTEEKLKPKIPDAYSPTSIVGLRITLQEIAQIVSWFRSFSYDFGDTIKKLDAARTLLSSLVNQYKEAEAAKLPKTATTVELQKYQKLTAKK